MKLKILILTMAAAFLMPLAASAQTQELIPPFHWTYHLLRSFSDKGLIDEKVEPGKSAFTQPQVVSMLVMALKHVEKEIDKLDSDGLAAMRTLAQSYRPYFKEAGYDYETIRNDIEMAAMRAGLSAIETNDDFSANPKALTVKAASAVNGFTFDLYGRLAAAQKDKSLFVSPYSVISALSMCYAGARGVTEAQMAKVLFLVPDIHKNMGALINELNTVPQDTAQLRAANSIWPAKGTKILPEFSQTVKHWYNAQMTPLNYKASPEAARKTINSWVSKQTNKKIENIIQPGILTKNTLMVLANAVYFKSSWLEEFEPEKSQPRAFWPTPAKSVNVVTMSRTGDKVNYAKLSDAEMVELPYKDNRFSMIVLLPDKSSNIQTLEKAMNANQFDEWLAAMSPRRVKIFLPKFKQENDYELAPVLAALGMPSAFKAGEANFSGITGENNIYISNILHKTFIEVGEEGTEAAAATAVIMMKMSLPPQDNDAVVFRAERPFIYLIKDNRSGAIIFIGKYTKP